MHRPYSGARSLPYSIAIAIRIFPAGPALVLTHSTLAAAAEADIPAAFTQARTLLEQAKKLTFGLIDWVNKKEK